jgi:hypothetical protein
MKIKYFVILFFVFFAALLLFGCDPSGIGSADYGSAQINGYVMDATDNNAIKDVYIMTYPASDSVKSSESGNFFIANFYLNNNPQEVTIIAEKTGYQTAQVKLIVHSDETSTVTIPMTRK